MNFQDLQIFLAVAHNTSITATAKQLGIPKSTLSRRLANFEASLGMPLLHKTTRRITLTEAGEKLLQRADPLVEELRNVELELQSLHDEPTGSLRIQIPMDFLAGKISSLLTEFASEHQKLTLSCHQYTQTEANPEQFDLTLVCFELNLPASSWIARPLMSLKQGLFVSPDLAIDLDNLEALARTPCICAPNEAYWHFRVNQAVQALDIHPSLQFDSPLMRMQAAIEGGGIIKAPLLSVEQAVIEGQLKPLAFPADPVALSVSVLYQSRFAPAKVRVLLDYLQTHLAQYNQ